MKQVIMHKQSEFMIRLPQICNPFQLQLLTHFQVINYNYNYLSLVINYVINYYYNRLQYNTGSVFVGVLVRHWVLQRCNHWDDDVTHPDDLPTRRTGPDLHLRHVTRPHLLIYLTNRTRKVQEL